MSDPFATFRIEAEEHLVNLEHAMLELESDPADRELIDSAFRSMHTIKGAGGMFGFDDLSAFTHHLETAFDKIREGQFSVTADLISVVLDARDHIQGLLENQQQTPEQAQTGLSLLDRLNQIVPATASSHANDTAPISEQASPTDTTPASAELTFKIQFKPNLETFLAGMSPIPILRELQELGDAFIITLVDVLPDLDDYDPTHCYFHWDVILTTAVPIDQIEDVFLFVSDDWEISITEITIDEEDEPAKLGALLVDQGIVSDQDMGEALESQVKIGKVLLQNEAISSEQLNAALTEQKALNETRERKLQKSLSDNVRVPTEKLDILMDLVGEMVITQARLTQAAHNLQDSELQNIAEGLDRLCTELRDNTFSIRMMPIGTIFSRFKRLVRDLANELGKDIQLVTEGGETELDKTVIDGLSDPLVHLIRNSIDHGIEDRETRLNNGKPERGTVKLSAHHAESNVIIRIEDDGAGLNTDRIKAKAQEQGIIQPNESLSDHEINQLIFAAGFSTAAEVSNISGRGVGMDVVKRSIESLRGEIELQSEPGKGTCIVIRMPLTLAIIDGLAIKVGNEHFILPLSVVEECIELTAQDKQVYDGNRQIPVRDQLVPYLSLREWFGTSGESGDIEQMVIVQAGDQKVGIVVDEVIGQHQTVIKSLGRIYQGVQGLAGATILGDGSVSLIIDVQRLMQNYEEEIKTNTVH